MKKRFIFLAAFWVLGAMAALPGAHAADALEGTQGGSILIPNTTPGAIDDATDKQPAELQKDKPEKPEKPPKPEKPERPDIGHGNAPDKTALTDLKADFRAQAEEYQKKQKELLTQMKRASAEERGKIREDLKDLKAKFKDLRQEIGDKIAELKPKIDREALEDAKEHGRPRK